MIFIFCKTGSAGEKLVLLFADISIEYSEHVYIHDTVIMHVFNSSFWQKPNFDNSLYNDPLTVNPVFIFIMSRVVDGK